MTTPSLETYARILARLACRRGARLEEILSELGISADDFNRAEPVLRAELSGSWPNRKGITAMKFATALGNELERLGALEAAPGQPAALSGDPRLPLPSLDEARAREPDVPSFLQAARFPAPIAPMMSIAASPEPPAPPLVIHAPIPAEPAPESTLAGTAHMDLHALVAATKRGESALPFNPSEAPPPSAAAEPSLRPTVELPSRPRLSGTIDADLSAIVTSVKRGALPFGGSQESTPPSVAASGSDVDSAQFPLELYASVTGALARGEPRDAVLARHGMSPDAYDRMAKAWAQRFQREPQMLTRFQELARSNAASPRRTE